MKTFALTALFLGTVAGKKVGGGADAPSTRFNDPDHVPNVNPNPKPTQCSHTTCVMIEQVTPYGKHEVMSIIHDNLESKCARYQTVSTSAGLNNHVYHADRKVHCGRVKRWVASPHHAKGGKFVYDGECECHVAGSHPNGNSALNVYHPTEAPKATAAPVVPGVTKVTTTVIDTKINLPGVSIAAFTAAVQEGVVVAIAMQVGVHRSQVSLVNIGASGGRRLQESAAAGVSFDVLITVKSDPAVASKAITKLASLATVTAANAAEREHFSDIIAEQMIKAARASPTPPSAAVIQTLANVVVAVEEAPTDSTTSVKAGCYVKAHSCPNHKWASGSWNWHAHGTKMGKAYCLSDADNHHRACGGDVTDPWSQKWVDNTGEATKTFPSPGCYWKLPVCPNHPNWVTTPAKGGSATGWKKHGIADQKRCIASAWSHHVLCGLPDTEPSATMFIGDENSDDASKATKHAVSCGVHKQIKLPAVAVSMSSRYSHSRYQAKQCTDGKTDNHYGFCHSKKERAWIKLDLGHTYATSSVIITNRKDCCQHRFDDHVIETSNDDVNWTTCFRGVLPHRSGSFAEPCKAEARYVRARMINPEYLNLQEVEVRGSPLCGLSHKPHTSVAAPHSGATFSMGAPAKLPVVSASMSSEHRGYPASKCFDGNANNFCHSGNKNKPWLTYDMGKEVYVSSVNIYNRRNCCQNRLNKHALQVSSDNKTWRTCGTYTANSNLLFKEACSATGRFVRVQMLTNNWLNLGEVDVIGNAFPSDIAQLKVASASMSSGHRAYPASKCINGNLDDFCHSGNTNKPSLTLDMGKKVSVNRLVVTNRKDCCQNRLGMHVLELSNDGKTYTQCGTYDADSSAAFVEPCKGTARYVRLRMLHNDWLNLGEVQVFGSAAKSTKYQMMARGAKGCPAGKNIDTKAHCEAALADLGLQRDFFWQGNDGEIPVKCSWRGDHEGTGGHNGHFNSHRGAGKARSDLTPICKI